MGQTPLGTNPIWLHYIFSDDFQELLPLQSFGLEGFFYLEPRVERPVGPAKNRPGEAKIGI